VYDVCYCSYFVLTFTETAAEVLIGTLSGYAVGMEDPALSMSSGCTVGMDTVTIATPATEPSKSAVDMDTVTITTPATQPSNGTSSGSAVGIDVPPVSPMDAVSDMSFNDDSVADSDYVPDSVGETTTDYSTDDDISKVATLIKIKHARPVVHLPSVKNISKNRLQTVSLPTDETSQEIPVIPSADEPAVNPVTGCENVPASACTSRGSDRPSRPCPFCGKFKVRLTRHIRAVHNNEEEVKQHMTGRAIEQRAGFKQLKRNGIVTYNMKIAGRKDAKLLRERLSKNDSRTVVCDKCSGVFNRHWFSSHKSNCRAESEFGPSPVAASVFFSSFDVSEEFKKEILSRFAKDEVGKLCQEDETIVMIGCKLFRKLKSRQDKKIEVRRSVMTDMRRLSHVFTFFRDVLAQRNLGTATVPDMFKQEHLDFLHDACADYTSTGLKFSRIPPDLRSDTFKFRSDTSGVRSTT